MLLPSALPLLNKSKHVVQRLARQYVPRASQACVCNLTAYVGPALLSPPPQLPPPPFIFSPLLPLPFSSLPPSSSPSICSLSHDLSGHTGRDDPGQVWLGCSGRAAARDLQHCSTAGYREPNQNPMARLPHLPPPPPPASHPSFTCIARVSCLCADHQTRCDFNTQPLIHSIHAKPTITYMQANKPDESTSVLAG